MIRVKVDLVRYGNEQDTRQIGEMIIANDGTGDSVTGNYGFVWKDNNNFSGEGAVFGYERGMGIWELIYKCLGSQDDHDDQEFMDKLFSRLNNSKEKS